MRICFDQDSNLHPAGPHVIAYRATLDVPVRTARQLAAWLAAHRRRIGTRKGRRVLGCYRQAVLVLRWFHDDTTVRLLARVALGLLTKWAGAAACTLAVGWVGGACGRCLCCGYAAVRSPGGRRRRCGTVRAEGT